MMINEEKYIVNLAPPYPVFAITELTDSATSRKVSGSVEEISREGCHVGTMNVLPVGTSIKVRILHNQRIFMTKGEVFDALDRRGMGIVFVGTPKDQLAILELWLAERASIVASI